MIYIKRVLVVSFFILLVAQAKAEAISISSADWHVSSKDSVAKKSFDKQDVANFINSLNGDVENLAKEQIGDFKWIDIDNDGIYEFFITVSPSRFFTKLYTYRINNKKKFQNQVITVWDLEKLDGSVIDLDGDGIQELILPKELSSYRGVKPLPVWIAVYKWDGKEFNDSSKQFTDFYAQTLLPTIEAKINRILADRPIRNQKFSSANIKYQDEIYEETLAAQIIVRDKILRFIGQDKKAGLDKAKEWAQSDNPEMRINAILVFSEIDDEQSKEYLRRLGKDSNPNVVGEIQILKELKPEKH